MTADGTLYPMGYGTDMVTLSQMKARHLNFMHPVYAERLFAWIESQEGKVGIGGGRRLVQPDKAGFAPAGKSFHQDQRFASGFYGYSAVDLVHVNPGKIHRAPFWSEVPAQGSKWASEVKVHCNVNGEPWHMQAIEIDGYDSWVRAGRPDPKPKTSTPPRPPVVTPPVILPSTPPAPPTPTPTDPEDIMECFIRPAGSQAIYACFPGRKVWLVDHAAYELRVNLNNLSGQSSKNNLIDGADALLMKATWPVEGPTPTGHDAWGSPV